MSMLSHRHPVDLETLSPIDRVSPLKEFLNSAFQLASFGPRGEREWSPLMDIHEDKEKLTLKVEVPGMKKEDITISLEDDYLTVSGERKFEEEAKEGETYHCERFYGRFERTIGLPSSIKTTDVKATYENGILTIVLPKMEETKAKKIEINVK